MHPEKMALLAGKIWRKGRVLRVAFLDGSRTQRQRVMSRTSEWMKYANIQFKLATSPSSADIRISFEADSGSWSYVGTDNLGIDKSEPTMNFGWLTDDSDDDEYDRVYPIDTFRGCWELSSRKVFFVSRSSAVGCTVPLTSVTRDTSVCSPAVAPVHV